MSTQEMSSTATAANAKNAKQNAKRPRWSRKRRLLLFSSLSLVLLLLAGGLYWLLRPQVRPLAMPPLPANLSWADLGLANWQQYQQALPPRPLDDPALPREPQVNKASASLQHAAGLALLQQSQFDRGIAYLKAAVLSDPENLRVANDLRLTLRNQERYKEEEQFFAPLAEKLKTPATNLSLALSYVDQMRSCPKPPDGLVCQAQFSSRSISILNKILEEQPYNIIARYARGLNHLYWPTLMGHLPQSQEDLQYAVALTKYQQSMSPTFTPQAYTALGDVFAKGGKIDEARNVWLNGLNVSTDTSLLQSRLNIPRDLLVSEEESALRGLGVYVETDIAVFWQKEQ